LTAFLPLGISTATVGGCTEPLMVIQRIAAFEMLAGLIPSIINLQGYKV
jgi:hypothetical protein